MQEDVRDFLKTLWVPQVPQQKEYSAPRIALYRAVPDTVTGLEKKPPQRESETRVPSDHSASFARHNDSLNNVR
jgi:hypothetical protein